MEQDIVKDNDIDIIDDDSVEIICPECNNSVVIGQDNICPVCGCEFEEIQKKYRLSTLGIALSMLCSAIYIAVIFIVKFMGNTVGKIDEDSLFHMDALRMTGLKEFIAMTLLSAIVFAGSVALGFIKNNTIRIVISFICLISAIASMFLFWYTQKNCMFYIIPWGIFILTALQSLGCFCCFADCFIMPKSKL